MSAEVARFFPPGARVLPLPNAGRPKLYIESRSAPQRWRHSRLYPAFRITARGYRTMLRSLAAAGIGTTWVNASERWEMGDFLDDCLPDITAAVVCPGTPGPTQKTTVQLWHRSSVVGYLKYAPSPIAKRRLEQEHYVLGRLPDGVGPAVVTYGPFADGFALVTRSVPGKATLRDLPPGRDVRNFLLRLQQPSILPLDRHPWVERRRAELGEVIEPWLEPLADRTWPVVFQHGDFAPWNVIRSPSAEVTAIDWEYGSVQGFPHLDAAYYVLQVAALLRRWPPARAFAFAVRHLRLGVPPAQADAIVRLAAFEAYQQALGDGHEPAAPLQSWRRAVWKTE